MQKQPPSVRPGTLLGRDSDDLGDCDFDPLHRCNLFFEGAIHEHTQPGRNGSLPVRAVQVPSDGDVVATHKDVVCGKPLRQSFRDQGVNNQRVGRRDEANAEQVGQDEIDQRRVVVVPGTSQDKNAVPLSHWWLLLLLLLLLPTEARRTLQRRTSERLAFRGCGRDD